MELGKSIRGRYLSMGRRKGMVALSNLLTGYMPGRYGRRFLALRPLSLAHLKQAGKKGEGQGVVHLHSHLHFPWQVNLARHFTGIYQMAISKGIGTSSSRLLISSASSAGINANSSTSSFRRTPESSQANRMTQIPAIRTLCSSESKPLVARSLTPWIPAFAGMTGEKSGPPGLTLMPLAEEGFRRRHSLERAQSNGWGKNKGQVFNTWLTVTHPLTPSRRGRGNDMRLIGWGQTVGTNIRILSPRTVKNAADSSGYGQVPVAVREAPRQVMPENTSPLIRTRAVHESVRMVVKQETMNPAATEVPNQSESASVVPPIATTGPAATAVAAMQAAQPKIDVNRLTDEVYRMLERRLITERERRGR